MKIYILLFTPLVFSCAGNVKKYTSPMDTNHIQNLQNEKAIEIPETQLLAYSNEVLKCIHYMDFEKIGDYVHPIKGIRFSPYATIDTLHDVKLSVIDFKELSTGKANQKINWGTYDGSGEKINLSIKEYFKRFVYDIDFESKGKVMIHQFQKTGNSVNNLSEIYPLHPFVEYYYPGEDPKYEGMDWKVLRMVYGIHQNKWYLVAITHDEWTI